MIIPNPVSDGQLSVYLNITTAQHVSIRVFDAQGKLLRQHNSQMREGVTTYNTDVSTLQKGVYVVQVIGEDFRAMKKVVVD